MNFEVKDLTKSFNEKQVLKGISFSVSSGNALGLLGRNGAGKTTTIRIIMQLFKPDTGEVLFDGAPLDLDSVNIGYMPEERGLYPKKKVLEQLIYFARLKNVPLPEAKERAEVLLRRLEMDEYKNAKLSTLSKGNQQKIQLVATLISDPDIVILDEPFSGLDPVNAILLKDVVKELIADGKIVIFSSHQMNYVEEFCNSIVIIDKGEVAVSGVIRELKHNYVSNRYSIITENSESVSPLLLHSDFVSAVTTTADGLLVDLVPGVDKKVLIKVLADSDADFDGIMLYEPSLNDIFVEYTDHSGEEEGSK